MLYLYSQSVSVYVIQNQEGYADQEKEKEKIFIYATVRGPHKWKKEPQIIHTEKKLGEVYAVVLALNL